MKRLARKTRAKMGGLCEERPKKGRGGIKWREKANDRKQWKWPYSGVADDNPLKVKQEEQ